MWQAEFFFLTGSTRGPAQQWTTRLDAVRDGIRTAYARCLEVEGPMILLL